MDLDRIEEELGLTRPPNMEQPEIVDLEELLVYVDALVNHVGTVVHDVAYYENGHYRTGPAWGKDGLRIPLSDEEPEEDLVDPVVIKVLENAQQALELHEVNEEAQMMQERVETLLSRIDNDGIITDEERREEDEKTAKKIGSLSD